MTVPSAEPPLLSVVIPTYHEESRIGPALRKVAAYLGEQPWGSEIVVVDDGSADRTVAEVLAAADRAAVPIRLLRRGMNRGKGYTVREGMLAARGRLRLFSDADLSTPIEETSVLMEVLRRRNADLVIGSRALPGSLLGVRQPWYREGMGRLFNSLVRYVGLADCPDTQCGFKLLTADAARAIFPRLTIERFGFDVELIWIALSLGLRVWQVPIAWFDSPDSRVSPLRDGPAMIRDLVRIRLNDWRGRYRPPPP
jgi:dolichyl-phosphate beta-glucosyltransferase